MNSKSTGRPSRPKPRCWRRSTWIVDKNFGVTLTGPDFKELKTFRDFYDLIISRTNGK